MLNEAPLMNQEEGTQIIYINNHEKFDYNILKEESENKTNRN